MMPFFLVAIGSISDLKNVIPRCCRSSHWRYSS